MNNKRLVTIVCYNKVSQMDRQQAWNFYKQLFDNTEGAEKTRYKNILIDIKDLRDIAYDGASKIPKGYHRCKYCDWIAEGDFEDLLCSDCRESFGHSLYSEL